MSWPRALPSDSLAPAPPPAQCPWGSLLSGALRSAWGHPGHSCPMELGGLWMSQASGVPADS